MSRIPRHAPTLDLHARLTTAPPAERRSLLSALGQVVTTLTGEPAPESRDALLQSFEDLLTPADPSIVWLALSVLDAELATAEDVRRTVRAIRLDGVATAFGTDPGRTARTWLLGRGRRPEVHVLSDVVLVDVDHTARTGLATGIQRVARETVRRWVRDHDEVRLVGWGQDHRTLRLLDVDERRKALTGEGTTRALASPPVVVVPWEAGYLLPELSSERTRNERIAALAQFARCRTGVIGFDCVPISTAETTAMGVSEAFATNLAAVRHMDHVSAISRAAATEYGGWRTMLPSVGSQGPEISADLLPIEAPAATPEHMAEAEEALTVPGLPMVLCVGTHEPRKNHLALLHASELLWREGLQFSLVLVGGRSWNDERFQQALAGARARNRPVETARTLSDDGLWAAYRLARFMVFPSLNEGYGLPVAEALACGTPVVTTGYGSMAEIAEDGGALLVDPRDDHSIADAMRTLLSDDEVHGQLAAAAAARPRRSWDQYAEQVWSALLG